MGDKSAGNNWQAARAVFWGFFGVRKKADYESDAKHLTPAQIMVIGVLSAGVFVATVLGVVMLVTS